MPIDMLVQENGKISTEFRAEIIGNKLLRSNTVQEIISSRPGFTERWALLIFLLILLLIIVGTWFIKYPDIVQANAVLTVANAPKEIVIRQDGKLQRLFFANDNMVTQGQIIGWIESTANHREVIALAGLLEQAGHFLARGETEKVSSLFGKPFSSLGELQSYYQQFVTAWQQFNDYLVNGFYYKREKMLFEDYDFLKKAHNTLEQQEQLTEEDLQLTNETFAANDSLYKEKVISKQDLRDQRSKLVGKKIGIPQLKFTLLSNENQQTAKQKEIDEIEHTISIQKSIFLQAIQTLKSLTDDWMKKYIIKAPVDGKVVFIVPLQENQFMQSGKTVGFINPNDSRYYAQVTLPQNNFGKVDVGQKVQLRFDAYPYQEFGFVAGKLNYISKVALDSGFLANIELPKGLVTNYGRTIQYRNGLKSQALIITRDARLLQRFYYTMVKTLHQ